MTEHRHDSSCVDRDDNVLDDRTADQEQAGSGEDRLPAIVREMGNTADGIRHCLGHDNNTWLISELARVREQIEQLKNYNGTVYIQAVHEERDRLKADLERVTGELERGRALVEDMDLRMPEHATEDADGFITSYRIPVGPWHRLLGWSRGGAFASLDTTRKAQSDD